MKIVLYNFYLLRVDQYIDCVYREYFKVFNFYIFSSVNVLDKKIFTNENDYLHFIYFIDKIEKKRKK